MRAHSLILTFMLCFSAGLACSDDDQNAADAATIDGPRTGDSAVDGAPVDDGSHDRFVGEQPGGDLPTSDLPASDGPVPDHTPKDRSSAHDGPAPDPGPVQCRDDNECAMGQICNREAPGGICIGCGTCLDPIDFECRAGACVRTCSGEHDCNAGMRCANTGYCVIRSCSGSEPCPAPYTCNDSGRCGRPLCSVADSSCPAPLFCKASICIEP